MGRRFTLGVSFLAGLMILACGGAGGQDDPLRFGSVVAMIEMIPDDVQCVWIVVSTSDGNRRVKADVTPGDSAEIVIKRIPAGEAELVGYAFDEVCDATDGDSIPTWTTDRVTADIVPGVRQPVVLTFSHTGEAEVILDFDMDTGEDTAKDTGEDTGTGEPVDCDADGDGYFTEDPACDDLAGDAPRDCDDANSDVFPGAPMVCGDGVLNNCEVLPPDVASAFAIEEIGVLSIDPVYVAESGFHNNVSIAAFVDQDAGPVAMITSMESADTARIVRIDFDNPSTARTLNATFPSNVRPMNYSVEVIKREDNSFLVGGIALEQINYRESYRPMFAEVGLLDEEADFVLVQPGSDCSLRGAPDDWLTHSATGLTDYGYFFEVVSEDTQTNRVFFANQNQVVCRDLAELSFPYREFGSSLTASSTLAVGLFFDTRTTLWTWDYPTNYDDFHTFDLSYSAASPGILLADHIMYPDSVLHYVYRANPDLLVVESMNCSGLNPCTPLGVSTRSLSDDDAYTYLELTVARMGLGSVTVTWTREDPPETALSELSMHFIGEDGTILGGDYALSLGTVGGDDPPNEAMRWLDATVVLPTAARDWYDILVALAVERQVTGQPEIRLARVRACEKL